MPDPSSIPFAMQAAMQPLVKLTQSNMELLTRFSMSPEVLSKSAATTQTLLQQGQQAAAELVKSNAFAQLTQGIIKNYIDFVMEMGQSGMAVFAQGQAELVKQAHQISSGAVDAAQASSRQAH